MSEFSDPRKFPWEEIDKLDKFGSSKWTDWITKGLSVYNPHNREVDEDRRKIVLDLLNEHSPTALSRLKDLQERLNNMFVNKQEIIKMIIVSAIAQQPMLLIGEPGTAKSKIITSFCEMLGIGRIGEAKVRQFCFQYLLHNFTEPDEVVGPVDIGALQQVPPEFKRFRAGTIVDAEVIFLDEVFKANSAILNSLLTIINERYVYEGGKSHRAAARMIFGASNETPKPKQLEELHAFYERFIIRMHSEKIEMKFDNDGPPTDRAQLLEKGWASEVVSQRAGYDPVESAVDQVSCLNDILLCNRAVTELWGGEKLDDPKIKAFLNHYHHLVTCLAKGSMPICRIDDRKFIRLFLVIRAHSFYRNNTPPDVEDLCVLKHTWDDLSSKEIVSSEVEKYMEYR